MRAALLYGVECAKRSTFLLALGLFLTTFVVIQASTCVAEEIQRGPSSRRSPVLAQSPIVIRSGDLVRIGMTDHPERIPGRMRGQFEGSIVGVNHEHLTVVLPDGTPAIVHRDLVAEVQVGANHGSRSKHALVGFLVGTVIGGAIGFASGDDTPDELIEFNRGESALIGVILLAPLGTLIGVGLPAGQYWTPPVPINAVEWSVPAAAGTK